MTRFWLICFLLLLLNSSGHAQKAAPLCINDLAGMPKGWLPSEEQVISQKSSPWQAGESQNVKKAVESGIDEITAFFAHEPSAVQNLWDDSIEALMQVTHSSANDPALDKKIRTTSRENLSALIKTYKDFNNDDVTCEEFGKVLPLALFAHRLFPAYDNRVTAVTKLTNAAYRECYSLKDATNVDLQDLTVDDHDLSDDDLELLFEASVWSIWLLEASRIPQLKIPTGAPQYVFKLWNRLKALPLPDSDAFDGGAHNRKFVILADLATHIAHVPTAVHRFPLYVSDHPDLYRFHRENFYPVMATGDMDLLASFVDSLRQYGCTPTNDRQVRDGTRYLMVQFHKAGDRWMRDEQLDDYDRVHRPWTAMLGIRDRKLEKPAPGSLGAFIRKHLFSAASDTSN